MMTSVSSQRVSKEERREAILDAARQHFGTSGYHGTGMDSVAATLGLSKPIMYQYFASKRELYLAVLDEAAQHLESIITTAMTQPGDSNRFVVEATVRAFFEFVADEKQYYRLLFSSDMLDDADAARIVQRVTNSCVEHVAQHIVKDTGLDDDLAHVLASSVVGSSQFAAKAWRERNQARGSSAPDDVNASLVTAAQLTARSLWRGLRSIPARSA